MIWRALAVAAIGMLLTLFLQPQLERVADAVTRQPLMAGSFGLLAVVVTPLAMLIMIVTLILIPVAIVVALLVPLAWLFGMVALGQEVGERFTKAINQIWAPVLSTGFGTFLLCTGRRIYWTDPMHGLVAGLPYRTYCSWRRGNDMVWHTFRAGHNQSSPTPCGSSARFITDSKRQQNLHDIMKTALEIIPRRFSFMEENMVQTRNSKYPDPQHPPAADRGFRHTSRNGTSDRRSRP